jgi:serine/threonine protein kinase
MHIGKTACTLSDIWRFGVIAYEVMSLSRPFRSKKLFNKITLKILYPLEGNFRLALKEIVMKMFSRNPDNQAFPLNAMLTNLMKNSE